MYPKKYKGLTPKQLEKKVNKLGYNWHTFTDTPVEDSEKDSPKTQHVRNKLTELNPLDLATPTIMTDALTNATNFAVKTDTDITYGKGVLVGVTAAIMAMSGASFNEVWSNLKPYLKDSKLTPECIPTGWDDLCLR
jgi:hypothetical protein